MKNFQPYTIRQLQLADWPSWRQQCLQGPLYAVVWHKEVPLADFYVDEEQLRLPQLSERLNSRLQAAVQYYAAEARRQPVSLATEEPEKALVLPAAIWEDGTTADWHTYLDELLADQGKVPEEEEIPVAVIICTRHRAGQLASCLRSLETLPNRPAEVVVVDNGPDDPATAALLKQFPHFTYVAEPRPGLDIARNTGLRTATQPIVAYIDDDVQLHPAWLYRVHQAFADPELAALTGLVLTAELKTEAQWIFERYWSFNRGFVPKSYSPDFLQQHLAAGPPVWEIGAGANMAFRREIFETTGLFDERLDAGAAGCNGDSEMWFRILQAGYRIGYEPRAVVWHEHRTSLPGLKRQIYQYMRGFATAALLQQEQLSTAGYQQHLNKTLPAYYRKMLWKGFPFYRAQFRTLWSEIRGLRAGKKYYQEHCFMKTNQPPTL